MESPAIASASQATAADGERSTLFNMVESTPFLRASVGPSNTPSTEVVDEVFCGRLSGAIPNDSTSMRLGLDGASSQPREPEMPLRQDTSDSSATATDASHEVPAVQHAEPVLSASTVQQPAACLSAQQLQEIAALMFASGAGEAVTSGSGIRVSAATFELILHAGAAITRLFAERRAELRRPGGELDTVETCVCVA